MFVRNLLLVVGALCLLGGVALTVVWFNQTATTSVERTAATQPAVLVATHLIPAGTLLRPEDIGWKEVGTGEIRPGNLVRGQISESAFVGAITRRDFAANEDLMASELVKPSERQFLSAVLKPGTRAVSISVDEPQNAAGLILPGDRVDVILTQTFDEVATDPTRKSVAETMMRNIQVIAVDQSLSKDAKPAAAAGGAFTPATAVRIPKTVTFEVTENQAERLFVAAQLGRLQLSVRPLQGHTAAAAEANGKRRPTWASDVSSALNEIAHKAPPGVSVENAIRRPPVVSQ
jgi:pilus assembly protein CpaB